jgi:hypothetical protein
MPFTWQININPGKSPGTFTFDPNPLPDPSSGNTISVGDQIFWTNNDTVPHHPGVTNYPTVFMPQQIAPGATSPAFVPDSSFSGQTVTYGDTLPGAPPVTATIVISTN